MIGKLMILIPATIILFIFIYMGIKTLVEAIKDRDKETIIAFFIAVGVLIYIFTSYFFIAKGV